jgi:hypothetical protein
MPTFSIEAFIKLLLADEEQLELVLNCVSLSEDALTSTLSLAISLLNDRSTKFSAVLTFFKPFSDVDNCLPKSNLGILQAEGKETCTCPKKLFRRSTGKHKIFSNKSDIHFLSDAKNARTLPINLKKKSKSLSRISVLTPMSQLMAHFKSEFENDAFPIRDKYFEIKESSLFFSFNSSF